MVPGRLVSRRGRKINPSNAELNPIRHLLAFVGARHIVHVSRARVKRTCHCVTLCVHFLCCWLLNLVVHKVSTSDLQDCLNTSRFIQVWIEGRRKLHWQKTEKKRAGNATGMLCLHIHGAAASLVAWTYNNNNNNTYLLQLGWRPVAVVIYMYTNMN